MRKGVSLTTVVIAITVMMILIASVSVIGSSAINSANFEEYKSEIERVANEVNLYITENDTLPTTNEVISINTLESEFLNSLNENNDISNKLYVVDISKSDGSARVINCFSYAKITGGTVKAGIVGYNQTASTTEVTNGKYEKLKTMVVNCMLMSSA